MTRKRPFKHLSEEHKLNISKALKGRVVAKKTREILSIKNKIAHSKPETKAKMSKSVKEGLAKSEKAKNKKSGRSKGFTLSEEHKDRIRQAHIGKKLTQEHKETLKESMTRSHKRIEVRSRISSGVKKYLETAPVRNFKESSIERRVREYLLSTGVNFIIQFPLENYFYDFLIEEKIILEVHGGFWHMDPRVCRGQKTYNQQIEHKEKDRLKAKTAVDKGYLYRVVWEIEVQKSDFIFIDRILNEELY